MPKRKTPYDRDHVEGFLLGGEGMKQKEWKGETERNAEK